MENYFDTGPDPSMLIRPWLKPGETLVWAGVPKKGLVLRRNDLFLIPFSILWLGFSCVWEIFVYIEKVLIMELFGLIFVFAGLVLLIGRFFIDAWWRRDTLYGITDQRIFVVQPALFGKKVENSIPIKDINNVSYTEKSDGSGTLKFSAEIATTFSFPKKYSDQIFYDYKSAVFDMIPHVRTVYNIVNQKLDKDKMTISN
jgi:hypothetical protein